MPCSFQDYPRDSLTYLDKNIILYHIQVKEAQLIFIPPYYATLMNSSEFYIIMNLSLIFDFILVNILSSYPN